MDKKLLEVKDLKTYFFLKRGVVKAVDGVTFHVKEGESVGLVGESGCGKSITCLSLLRLVPQPAGRIAGGEIVFEGEDLVPKSDSEMRSYRGQKIAMILQDPMASLNPLFNIGTQVGEPLVYHKGIRGRDLLERILEVLKWVRIPDPESRLGNYPHQFSGGMRQRVCASAAVISTPRLLLADEPTTSLDVTIQAQFLRLLKELQQKTGLAIVLVTHDLGIVAQTVKRVYVMYAGRIVEAGSVRRIYKEPAHPYTIALMGSVPKLGVKVDRLFQIEGKPPDLLNLPPGCAFAPRCPRKKTGVCHEDEYPPQVSLGDEEWVKCWLYA